MAVPPFFRPARLGPLRAPPRPGGFRPNPKPLLLTLGLKRPVFYNFFRCSLNMFLEKNIITKLRIWHLLNNEISNLMTNECSARRFFRRKDRAVLLSRRVPPPFPCSGFDFFTFCPSWLLVQRSGGPQIFNIFEYLVFRYSTQY